MSSEWYYKIMGEEYGPLSPSELKTKAASGDILPEALIRKGTAGEWVSALAVKGLFSHKPVPSSEPPASQVVSKATKTCPWCAETIALDARKCKHCGEMLGAPPSLRPPKIPTPPSAGPPDSAGAKGSQKIVLPAVLLLLFFGTLGLHAFYAGRKLQGFLILGLSFASIILFFTRLVAPVFMVLAPVVWLTLAVFLIGDFFRIIVGAYKDQNGDPITRWT